MDHDNIQQRRFIRNTPASFNPNPLWPKGYFEILAEAEVSEKERFFFAHGVRQFLTTIAENRDGLLDRDRAENFFDVLSKDVGIMEWQVARAEKALVRWQHLLITNLI